MTTPLIDIEDLYTGYNGVPVVRDLNLHVDAGRDRRAARARTARARPRRCSRSSGLNPIIKGDIKLFGDARSRAGART